MSTKIAKIVAKKTIKLQDLDNFSYFVGSNPARSNIRNSIYFWLNIVYWKLHKGRYVLIYSVHELLSTYLYEPPSVRSNSKNLGDSIVNVNIIIAIR